MVDPLSIPVPTEEQLLREEREDEWYAEAAISDAEARMACLSACDLCVDVGIVKDATCERTLGHVWVSVCDAHAYRIDSASRARG